MTRTHWHVNKAMTDARTKHGVSTCKYLLWNVNALLNACKDVENTCRVVSHLKGQKCQTSWKKGQIIHSLLECYCSMIYYCRNNGFIKCHCNLIVMLCYNRWVVGVTWNLKGLSHHLGTSVILLSSSMTLIFEFEKMEWTANICRPTQTEKPFPDDANSHNNKQWAMNGTH